MFRWMLLRLLRPFGGTGTAGGTVCGDLGLAERVAGSLALAERTRGVAALTERVTGTLALEDC
jgi:hypothetical protein